MKAPAALEIADALRSLQLQVAALGVRLADERTRGAGVERVARPLEQCMLSDRCVFQKTSGGEARRST